MSIRRATLSDKDGIKQLLDQLGYPGTEDFLENKINLVINNPLSELLVYDHGKSIAGFIIIDFLPQLGLKGDIARIGYFAVDTAFRGRGIGAEMEAYCDMLARQRGCDRIEVHCHERRKDAHRFYFRQGYHESPKYLMKSLDD